MNIVICQAQIKRTDLVQADGLQIGKLFDHVRYVLHMMYMTHASRKENQGTCNYRAPGAGLSGRKIGHGKGDRFTPCHSEAARDRLTRLGEIQNSNHVTHPPLLTRYLLRAHDTFGVRCETFSAPI
jgi:hypothetical protein